MIDITKENLLPSPIFGTQYGSYGDGAWNIMIGIGIFIRGTPLMVSNDHINIDTYIHQIYAKE